MIYGTEPLRRSAMQHGISEIVCKARTDRFFASATCAARLAGNCEGTMAIARHGGHALSQLWALLPLSAGRAS
jgi:hypothetical protein